MTDRDSAVDDHIKRSSKLKEDRATWDTKARDIAELIRPLRNEINGPRPADEKRDRGVYDSTGINANQNLGAGLFGTFCNPADKWFAYGPLDDELGRNVRVRRWHEVETSRALKSMTPSFSSFYSQVISFFLDQGAFGNSVFSSEMNAAGTGFVDVCRPLSQCWWDVDINGDVDTMYRRWFVPVRQAIAEWGGKISQKTRDRAEKEPERPIELLHAVLPAKSDMARDTFRTNQPFMSIYAEVEECHRITESGYFEFPYQVGRWEVAAGEKMGRGPGEIALADMKTTNVAARDNIKAGNLAASPPWGAPDEGVVQNIRIAPNKVSYGAVDRQGRQLLKPLLQGSNLPWSIELANSFREAVKDAFYFSLMQLAGRTGMTATEVLELREERMRLLAPYGARIQNDFLCPFTLRRFGMLRRAGVTAPPPPEMAGRSMQVTFTSPFALAQKSAAANSVLRTIAAAAQVAQFDPEIMDRIDNDRALSHIQEGFGAPADILRTDEETEARRDARRKAQQAQMTAEIADKGAGALAKGASAVATMRQAQQQPQAAA